MLGKVLLQEGYAPIEVALRGGRGPTHTVVLDRAHRRAGGSNVGAIQGKKMDVRVAEQGDMTLRQERLSGFKAWSFRPI